MSGGAARCGVAICLVMGTVVGCGDGSGDPPVAGSIPAVVEELQDAFVDRDERAICKLMSSSAQAQASTFAHGQVPQNCPGAVTAALRMIDDVRGWEGSRVPDLERVVGQGGNRLATMTLPGGWQADIPFAKERGGWKWDGFFGAAGQDIDRSHRTQWNASFPQRGAQAVEVRDASGKVCPPLRERRQPRATISGGCVMRARGEDIPVRVLSPFGDFLFGTCTVLFKVGVDGAGRAWIDDFTMDSADLDSACGDVSLCSKTVEESTSRPWKARLRSVGENGGHVLRVDMCMWTCAGTFIGPLEMRVDQTDRGWELAQINTGRSGVKMEGKIPLTGRSVVAALPSGPAL